MNVPPRLLTRKYVNFLPASPFSNEPYRKPSPIPHSSFLGSPSNDPFYSLHFPSIYEPMLEVMNRRCNAVKWHVQIRSDTINLNLGRASCAWTHKWMASLAFQKQSTRECLPFCHRFLPSFNPDYLHSCLFLRTKKKGTDLKFRIPQGLLLVSNEIGNVDNIILLSSEIQLSNN